MNKTFNAISPGSVAIRAGRILIFLLLAAQTSRAGVLPIAVANGTVSGSGTGPYTYDLTFGADSSSLSPVGSVWYSWTPGFFYLPGMPTSASAPAGWTASVSGNSVQFSANSPANAILPGNNLSGFSYQANFSPAQLAAAANSGLSVAYSGGILSDSGYTFTVQTVEVPEPSALTLLLGGLTVWLLASRRRLAQKRLS